MTAPGMASVRFSVRAALGLWVDIARQRPAAFASVTLVAIGLQTLLLASQAYFMSVMGDAALSVQTDPVTFSPAYLQASALSTLVALVSVVIWVALETVWLRLFISEARPWAVSFGQFGRLCAAFLIVFALFIVGYIILVIIAILIGLLALTMGFQLPGTPGVPELVLGFVAAYGVSLLLIALVMVRLSALPALAVMHRSIDFAGAWRATRGVFWRACAAFAIGYLLYGVLLVVLYFVGRTWTGLTSAYRDMFALAYPPRFEDRVLVDPNIAFAGLFDASGSLGWVWFDSFLVAVIATLFAVIMRSIGITLARRVSAPAPDPVPETPPVKTA